ncbi:MAG: lipoyl synthase [Actinobacteria bacterium]|nr:lipoyl synthase [Actinomycetota bacterium]
MTDATLRVRWLGTVAYREAWSLQRALHRQALVVAEAGGRPDDHLLLLEHPPTLTLGRQTNPAHLLVDRDTPKFDVLDVDRGGDVTYHGPGQLVAYPLLGLPGKGSGDLPDTPAHVRLLEGVLIDVVRALGIDPVGRLDGYPGVWIDPDGSRPRKVAAIGVRIVGGRSLHGVALNVDPDMSHFDSIVPCGISEHGVTSLAAEGAAVDLREVAEEFVDRFAAAWEPMAVERADVAWRHDPDGADLSDFSRFGAPDPGAGRNEPAGVSVRLRGRLEAAGVAVGDGAMGPKPDWMRARWRHDPNVLSVKRTIGDLDLVTVCEEAGCPNLSECWSEGTATFMLCGERCTRACGFCLVDTRHPGGLDAGEPDRVAAAVERMGLDHAVLTMVARDDLVDGGADHVARTVAAIGSLAPECSVEVLISDLRGSASALETVLAAGPEVLNHNVETVPRLQRAVRPSAGYARSLTVLGRAAETGVVVKSGLIVGMGERTDEVHATMCDLAAVGVEVVTIGQYLRPTARHLPVARWWRPEEFEALVEFGRSVGLRHVEASPFTRSSHHARSSYLRALEARHRVPAWG